jgi:hypothetical protein
MCGMFGSEQIADAVYHRPTLSEEFMQHLGLPQDGSLIEFQNFLAPHDPES